MNYKLEVIENDQPLTPEELDYLVANPPRDGRSIIKTIPPETAGYALEKYNRGNRPFRSKSIRTFADVMREDRWRLNGETMSFTNKQRIGNGQNRFRACVVAEKPFRTHIVFGVEDDCFDTIDAGKPRDHADILKLMGANDYKVMAVAVRWIEWILTGKAAARKPAFSPHETGELYRNKYKAAEDFTKEARKIAYKNFHSPGVVAAFLYCFDKIDSDLAGDFSDAWAATTRVDDSRFFAIAKMQAELKVLREAGLKGSDAFQTTRAALIILAWNAARRFQQTGKTTGVAITWKRTQPFPMIK